MCACIFDIKIVFFRVLRKRQRMRGTFLMKSKRVRIVIVLVFVILLLLFLKELFAQKFTSVEDFRDYMDGFGIWGPLVLTLFQAFQVVVPVLPGYLGCVAGAIAFGPAVGFACNYIGISVGSIIAYYVARRYGMDVVLSMFSEKMYDKWSKRIEKSKSYDWFLFLATLLPLFPDDFLCYFSGLIRMKARKFIWIIVIGKPWCILGYSLFFGLIK